MNQASQWRQAIAHRLAQVYAANPHVAAVALGGSTARGHADAYSDIELGVFWRQPPTEQERQAAVEQIGADLLRLYPYEPDEAIWSDDYMIGRVAPNAAKSGVLVEVAHSLDEHVERTLTQVLHDHDPDQWKHNLIAGIVDGVALHGIDQIQHWRARAAAYPTELAVAVVKRHAQIDHFWRWEMLLQRGENLMLLYQMFSQVQQQLLHVLLGLNRVYWFGFKWLDVVVERLAIAPDNLAARLSQVYHVPPAEGAQQLAALVEETYDLVEQHLPQIDGAWLRAVFRYRRPVWEREPPVA
jgi:predicted nucleotidyltransferase